MKQALEALECLFGIPEQFTGKGGGDVAVWRLGGSYRAQQAIPVLRQAIEQYEKEQQRESLGVCLKCGANECGSRDCPMNTQPQEEHHAKDCALLQIPSRDCDCSQNQEPVAEVAGRFGNMHIKFLPAGMFLQPGDPLYPAPQQREWVALTKEDIAALLSTHYMYMEDFVVAVDAKIKEKNGWTS